MIEHPELTPERLDWRERAIAAALRDLPALGYDFSPADARAWAKSSGESEDLWSSRWATTLYERAHQLGKPWPHLTAHVREAIRRHFSEEAPPEPTPLEAAGAAVLAALDTYVAGQAAKTVRTDVAGDVIPDVIPPEEIPE